MSDSPRTVLCVDDDLDDRELVCDAIGQIDPSLQVIHASDGYQAMEYLYMAKEQAVLPCLVILDINMPKFDGKATLAAIKNDEQLRKIPVVMFSTSNNLMDKMYCERYGVELVTKPSTLHNLHYEVKRLLQHCAV